MEKRKVVRNFLISAFGLLLLSFALFLLTAGSRTGSDIIVPCVISAVSNFLLATAYFLLIAWSFDRSNRQFLMALFGGMLIKMAALAVILIALVLSFRGGYVWIVATFMVYYFAFQILEIIFVARYLRRVKESG